MSVDSDSKTRALVVSGLAEAGAFGGGVFVVRDDDIEVIDEHPTTGIFFDETSRRWLRALSARELGSVRSEVLEYSASARGVRARRLTTVFDAHDVFSNATRRLVVATHDNSLIEIGGRRPMPVRVLPGEPDSWHLNCIEDVRGELFASAFRRGGTFRQWSENADGSGFVFSLASGAVVADGLSKPHSPRFVDGLWLICNSARSELVAVDPRDPSARVRTVGLGGYTRGLAFDDDHLYVGISVNRHYGNTGTATASIAIVDRKSWSLIKHVPVPCPEIYDVRLVPAWAPAMLKTPMPEPRAIDGRGLDRAKRPPGSTAHSDGIPSGLSVRFLAPNTIHAGDIFYVPTRVEHSGAAPLVVSHSNPLHLAYRWTGNDAAPVSIGQDEPLRTPLPATLTPMSHRDVDVVVRAPALAGRYRLRVVMVQEHVRWVDTTEPEAFLEVVLEVREPATR
jgi:Domain of unknown function (DUF4915)